MAGAVLSPLGLQSALAGKQDPCKAYCKCRNKRQQDQCLKACKACGKNTSRLVGTCGGYSCCATGQTSCGSFCAHLGSDVYNCGGCGNVCDQPGQYEYGACINGECRYECAEGALRCDGSCTFLGWDPNNCGACGDVCDAPGPNEYVACIDGRCEYACADGAVYCDGTCTFLGWDPANCGACGNVCPGNTPYCNEGTCGQIRCFGGQALCGGVCREISLDPSNCGGCGVVCGPGENCAGGLCQSAEPPG